MTRKLQILRGTTAQNNAYTGAVGELTMDTDRNEVRIHDGQTVGGIKIGDRNMPILTSMFFDHITNDMSWLRADTFSWRSGDVYVAAYEHLVDELKTDSLVYAWQEETSGVTEFTRSDTPSVGDLTLGGLEISVVGSEGDNYISAGASVKKYYRAPSLDRLVDSPSVDTIGNITITYYPAEDGHKICLPDQESNIVDLYEKTGAADYYILDTTNKQFKLPRKQKRALIQAVKNTDGTWYNLYSDGWVEQGGQFDNGTITFAVPMADINYCVTADQIRSGSTTVTHYGAYKFVNMTTTSMDLQSGQSEYPLISWKVSGYANPSAYASAGMRLEYYFVGNFEQSAVEQTAGITAETLNGKADADLGNIPANYDYVVESQLPTSDNGYTWYRKYKSGWAEQGGVGITSDVSLAFSATFPIVMADTNYTVLAISKTPSSTTTSTPHGCHYLSKTTTRCNIISLAGNSGHWGVAEVCWQVSGMSAQ